MTDILARPDQPLPVGSIGYRSSGWWGAILLVISEASIFAYLFFTYFYFSVQPSALWVPGGAPSFLYSAPQTVIMLIGCGAAWWANLSASRGEMPRVMLATAAMIVAAAIFVALQFLDWHSKPFTLATSTYSSIYFTIGGFHLAHVVAGLLIFAVLLVWTALGYFDAVRHVPITVGTLYWYFLAAVWLAVFFVLYITPYLA
jgi:heme/copper-type cytochrome/quinol oxidase subunit 3